MEHRSHRDDGARACDESGTTRPGRRRNTPRRREAQAHERDEVQWTKHAPRSDSQAQQPDLTSRGGVLQECVCMTDVHMTSPHDNHDHDYDNDHLHNHKGWRFGGSSPLMNHHPSGSRQGHPRYTGAVTTEGRGPTPTPRMAKSRCNDASHRQPNTRVFRQTKNGGKKAKTRNQQNQQNRKIKDPCFSLRKNHEKNRKINKSKKKKKTIKSQRKNR